MIISEAPFTKANQEIKQDELGTLFQPAVSTVCFHTLVYLLAFIVGSVFKINFVKQLLDFHKKLQGVGFVGKVLVENGLD